MATRPAPARKRRSRLAEYETKRDFAVTPEPRPGRARRSAGAPRFVVHDHHARRHHFDLRLEIDGALASWAVPKEPSDDPAERRLAVETEDHPLEYARFEGHIPEGEYGGGDSRIWDSGDYCTIPDGEQSEQRRKGRLHVELHGKKLRGRWHLIRMGRGRKAKWLLFRSKSEVAPPSPRRKRSRSARRAR